MKPVAREEILDHVTWSERRAAELPRVLSVKARRRVQVGGVLTFLFENHDTIRYQIQEMVRVEKMVREADIRHELETYNELLGGPGELGCTLLVELEDPAERSRKLRAWVDLPERLWARLGDGTRVSPFFDPRQRGEEKLSSVQFLRFPCGGQVPVALGVDAPGLSAEAALTDDQRAALAEDLAGGPQELPRRAPE